MDLTALFIDGTLPKGVGKKTSNNEFLNAEQDMNKIRVSDNTLLLKGTLLIEER